MKGPFRIIGLIVLLGMIALQFFQPEKNLRGDDPGYDPMAGMEVSDNVADLLKKACFDCHSNHTLYPWYSRISPVSWYLNKHIVEGKKALNFSEFENMTKSRKIGTMGEICEMVESGSMPLKSYLLFHRESKMAPSDVEAICRWSEAETTRILMLKK